jgi:hypothetical protein
MNFSDPMSRSKPEKEKIGPTAMLREITVANPYYSPSAPAEHREVKAWQSLRDDPLGRMFHRRQISESQYRAGRAWQSLWDAAEIGRIKTLDLTQTPVDGSPSASQGLSDRQWKAMQSLATLKAKLGLQGTYIVQAILVDKRTIRSLAETSGSFPAPAVTRYLGHRLRECLDEIARTLGLAS